MKKKPTNAIFEVYQGCNFNCVFCGDPKSSANTKVIDPGDETVFEVAHAIGKTGIFHVSISGGEFTLKPERTLKVIDILRSYNIETNINTNLTHVDKELFQELKKRGTTDILVSLHSYNAQTFESLVGKKGAFKKVLNNLELAIQEDMYIAPNMVVVNSTVNQITPTAEFLQKEFDINNFCITPVAAINQAHKNLLVQPEHVEQILDTVLDLTFNKGIYTRILRALPYCSVNDFEKYIPLLTMTCPAGISMVAVGPEGGVRICSHDSEVYGNLLTDSLDTITKRFDTQKHYPEYCTSCDFVPECRTGCIVETGVFEGASPYHRFPEKLKNITRENAYDVEYMDLGNRTLQFPGKIRYREEEDGTITAVVKDFQATLKPGEFELYKLLNDSSEQGLLEMNTFLSRTNINKNEINPFLNKLLITSLAKIYER